MPINDRIPEQSSPLENVIQAIGNNIVSSEVEEALISFFRAVDMKAQVAFDKAVATEKIVASMDEDLYTMSQESEALKDKLRKEFFNKPNKTNPIERGKHYQSVQGLDERQPDLDEDESIWQYSINFEDPYHQEMFDESADMLREINPELSTFKLYKLLTNT